MFRVTVSEPVAWEPWERREGERQPPSFEDVAAARHHIEAGRRRRAKRCDATAYVTLRRRGYGVLALWIIGASACKPVDGVYAADDPNRPIERPGASPVIVLAEIIDHVSHTGLPRADYLASEELLALRGRTFATEVSHTEVRVTEVLSGPDIRVDGTLAVARRTDHEWRSRPDQFGTIALFFLRPAAESSHTKLPMYQSATPGGLEVYMPRVSEGCEGVRTAAYTFAASRAGVTVAMYDPDVHTSNPDYLGSVVGAPISELLTDANACDMVLWDDFVDAFREDAKLHAPLSATENKKDL